MSERKDITRWNRAGLSRITYVDGNAAEYLEALRRELANYFQDTDWLEPNVPEPENEKIPADIDETLLELQKRQHTRAERIKDMYYQDRRDWAWEISRTFARSCHILTGYMDAWANEGFLETATQWDNIRCLVELIDYHPAPPASATTYLDIQAKGAGTIEKGFQVKNSPPKGRDKVVFETLEDLAIDPALNSLRPKGWNRSETPAFSGVPDSEDTQFSQLSELDVSNIQDIGKKWTKALNEAGIKNIYDFYDAAPDKLLTQLINDPDVDLDIPIGLNRLWEFKAKATTVCNFVPSSEWSSLFGMKLPDIVSETPEALAVISGQSEDKCKLLQLSIALVGACLDQQTYLKTTLGQSEASKAYKATEIITSSWKAGKKPKIEPGQAALVYHKDHKLAEAVTIAKIDSDTKYIHLKSYPHQETWYGWPLGEAVLRVSPSIKRSSWLTGTDVIRTEKPHGLTAGAYICCKDKNDTEKYIYSKVLVADARCLKLQIDQGMSLPYVGAKIMQALPIATNTLSADYLELNPDEADVNVAEVEISLPDEVDKPFNVYKPFPVTVKPVEGSEDSGGGGLLPPASIPGLGSFLFPSPFLPIDLVKMAIEMMLSMGIMIIPTTGEPVFKGMPIGGLFGDAEDIEDAASKMVEMLDNLVFPAVWGKDGYLVDTQKKPVYFEAICSSGADIGSNSDYVTTAGTAPTGKLTCEGEQIIDSMSGKPVGFQPRWSDFNEEAWAPAQENELFQIPMVNWSEEAKNDKTGAIAEMMGGDDVKPPFVFKEITANASDPAKEDLLPEPLLAVLEERPVVRATVVDSVPLYIFDGTSDGIGTGDLLAGQFEEGLFSLKVESVKEYSDDYVDQAFSLTFESIPVDIGDLEVIHAEFRADLDAEDSTVNNTLLTDTIELDTVPESLTVGRQVLLTGGDKEAVSAVIVDIDGNTIITEPPAVDFKKSELVVLGNVIQASHGEIKPWKILGSGDATKSSQEFVLEVKNISFPPDATMSTGVIGAIDVEVSGRIWQQVSTLKDSASDDTHYAIRMTEEGFIKILFGDGQSGRRLPSGKNNVRVRYRVGSGLTGNLPPHSLEKPVNPHSLVTSVSQPLVAAGGGDMESSTSLRERAPSTLLTLERAVSLADFANLAAGRSNIWQASAQTVNQHVGQLEQVAVTVVPADGVESKENLSNLCKYLQAHALPNVHVTVENFVKVTNFDMNVTLRIKSDEYMPEKIARTVENTVSEYFSLENRKLGARLYLSEVYKVVEDIEGVENSVCSLIQYEEDDLDKAHGKNVKYVDAGNEQNVAYLNAKRLTIETEEYQP